MASLRYFSSAALLALMFCGCDAFMNAPRPISKAATLEIYAISAVQTANSKQAVDPTTNASIFLTTPAIITTKDVETVQSEQEPDGFTTLLVVMTPTGAKQLAAATANPSGMRVAIVANGKVVATPEVMSPMSTAIKVSGGREINDALLESLTRE